MGTSIFDSFGMLREYLNQPQLSARDASQLWSLIQRAYWHDADRYVQEWQPYIQGYAHHFTSDFAEVTSFDELVNSYAMLPFARWTLHIDDLSFGDDELCELIQAPCFGSVSSLKLLQVGVSAQGAGELASCPALASVRYLSFGGEPFREETLLALMRSSYLTAVSTLSLWAPDVYEGDWIEALAQSPYLTSLSALDLDAVYLGGGVVALARSPYLSKLTRLNIGSAGIAADELIALSHAHWFGGLRVLNLNNNTVDDAGVEALCRAGSAPELIELSLYCNEVGDAGLEHLARTASFASLKTLSVGENEIGEAGIQALATSTSLTSLESLDLRFNAIGDIGASRLWSSSTLQNIQVLNLIGCGLGDAAILGLANVSGFPRLKEVCLAMNTFSTSAQEVLMRSPLAQRARIVLR